MRVEGASWHEVAKRFGYRNAASACNTLTTGHTDLWRRCYEQARAPYVDELEARADLTQRELMQQQIAKRDHRGQSVHDDEGNVVTVDVPFQVRQSAANSVKAHAAKLRAQKVELSGRVDMTAELYKTADASNLLEDDTPDEQKTVQSD